MDVKNKLSCFLIVVLFLAFVQAAPRSFTVTEGELVKVTPSAVDPDLDDVTYYFTMPLNHKGEWRTGLDDAGEHLVKITATDGEKRTVETIKIIVQNKNQPPVVEESNIAAKESQEIDLKSIISDPDNDALEYEFEDPFDRNGVWKTGFGDEGTFVTSFQVSDGEFEVSGRVEVKVVHTNQDPQIIHSFSQSNTVFVHENARLLFSVEAEDGDGDDLEYHWFLNGEEVSDDPIGDYYFDFESAGEHTLGVIVSDGIADVEDEWTVVVEKVNRRPELRLLPVNIKEGESVVLSLPETDVDGDEITYTFEAPLDNGMWKTGFDDAGTHRIKITFTDGEFVEEEIVQVIVEDVDRAPILKLPRRLQVKENEQLLWLLEAEDEDDDRVTFTIDNLPEGAILNRNTITWTPTFDTIRRKGGMLSNILNTLRLEHFLLRKKSIVANVTACGKELCTSGTVPIIVFNMNRGPSLEVEDVEVKETELASLEATGSDPDGDILHYYYTNPATKGKWQTKHGDAGEHTIWVTATDGKIGDTKTAIIDVEKENRPPTLTTRSDSLVVNEGQEFTVRVDASDPDGDDLEVRLDNIPPGASFADGVFIWQPDYRTVQGTTSSKFIQNSAFLNKKFNKDEAVTWLSFVVSDGEFEVVHPIEVRVKNMNQGPEIIGFSDVSEVNVGVPALFSVSVSEVDGDELTYDWSFGFGQKKVSGSDTVERTFMSPGEKKVNVVVSDGHKQAVHEWNVQVIGDPAAPVQAVPTSPESSAFGVKVYVIEG